ncbi:hypothetical protein WMF30_49160 [Sorangium sp. So ce134]
MSEAGPLFYAWCSEADRVDAFAAVISALVHPGGTCDVWIRSSDHAAEILRNAIAVEEAVATVRQNFAAGSRIYASLRVKLRSGTSLPFGVVCAGEEYERRGPWGPLYAWSPDRREVHLERVTIAISGARSVDVEAAVLSMQVQQDIEDLILRVCAPSEQRRVTTGACTDLWGWGAPIELCATYHAEARTVARDLALSWLYLHDGVKMERAAGMSLDELLARVEAAPHGAHVSVAGNMDRVREHLLLDHAANQPRDARATRVDAVRRGPRAALAGDVELTREVVLEALDTRPSVLLDALEASAVPDDEWRGVESAALETIAATKEGAPTYEADVTSRKHVQFIQRHAPYHVRPLSNGGMLLATHPFRTLWQLWADALFLLGITS